MSRGAKVVRLADRSKWPKGSFERQVEDMINAGIAHAETLKAEEEKARKPARRKPHRKVKAWKQTAFTFEVDTNAR